MQKFIARAVSAMEMTDVDTFAVVLAENMDGSGVRLEIQRALTFDEQDKKLGQDTYCLSTERGATHYGGIASWHISGNVLEVVLDKKAAKALGIADGFVVELPPDEKTLFILKEGLQRVLNVSN